VAWRWLSKKVEWVTLRAASDDNRQATARCHARRTRADETAMGDVLRGGVAGCGRRVARAVVAR